MASPKEAHQTKSFLPSPKTLAVSIALALSAMGVGNLSAAGLGRLTVQSALGQPLRAEVEVTSLGRDESSSLTARMAPQDAFRQAGLEFNPALTNLRFSIDRRPDGRVFVKINSVNPLNEPFIDLLVELNWASGKFIREYTFLLDPPELKINREGQEVAGTPRPVAPAVTESTPAPAAAAPAAPVPAPAAAAPAQRPAAPAAEPRRAPAAPAAAPAARTESPAGDVVVKPGETLAIIAGRVKPGTVSLDQAIVSIYRANPNAFFGSVHQLKAGSSLQIPDAGAMATVPPSEARSIVRSQAADFAAYRAKLADSTRTVASARAGQSASGEVGARDDGKGASNEARDRLQLSRSGSAAAPDAPAASGSVASKSAASAERRVAEEAAVREARSRVEGLEKNVSDLQKLLELKNKQLADLQKQVDDIRKAGPSTSGVIGQAQPAAVPPVASAPKAEAPKAEAPKVEPPKAPPPIAPLPSKAEAPVAAVPPVAVVPPVVEAPKAEAPKVETPKAEMPKAEPPKPAVPTPAAKSTPAATPAESPSVFEEVLANEWTLPGLGAILALGAGYAWYAMRRRKKEEKFEDSLIAAEAFTANSLFGSTGGQNVDTHNSMFTAGRETASDVHSTEVDPIAEAEVYIAYGRETQAEEILKEALKKQPERQAIRLKLLEIYAGRKDAKAFAAVAGDMYGMTGGQNEEWPKVVTLGLAIDPDNSLYTGRAAGATDSFGAQAPAAAVAPAAPAQSFFAEPILPAAEPMIPPAANNQAAAGPVVQPHVPQAPAAPQAPIAAMPDLNLPNFAETLPMAADLAKEQDAASEVPALDFDLDLTTTVGKAGGRLAAARDDSPSFGQVDSDLAKALDGKFELPSLDLAVSDVSAPMVSARAESSALADLGDLKIDLPSLESLEVRKAMAAEPAAIDLSAIGLDLQPTTVAPSPAGSDGVRWQEMATKLDLASAYEEIGDKEGARELLQEVVKGGDNDQQQKARSMLSKIS